jgi:TM2 domain-containing membrane protein YozV
MMYLLAIFCSPLALLFTGKPIQAILNFVLWIVSIVCWITIVLHSIGFALWAIAFIHAVLAINSAREDRRARWIANAQRR